MNPFLFYLMITSAAIVACLLAVLFIQLSVSYMAWAWVTVDPLVWRLGSLFGFSLGSILSFAMLADGVHKEC